MGNVTYGTFFPDGAEDVCMLSLDFARRLADTDPSSLVGREIVLGYAASTGNALVDTPIPIPGLNLQRSERKLQVVGIVEREPGPMGAIGLLTGVLIPIRLAQQIAVVDLSDPQALLRQLTNRRSHASVTVRVKRPQDTDEVERRIKELGFSAFSINDALQGAKRAFLMLDLLLGLTGSVALTVALLGIANTMVMSILERTREIGIMKAIGGNLLMNGGQGYLTLTAVIPMPLSVGRVSAGDLDGDGHNDIVLLGGDNECLVMFQVAPGSFAAPRALH